MKKIYAILAAAAAIVAAASCNKAEITSPETKGVNIHVSVADLAPATKAVKSGWTSGDKINIWFDGAVSKTPHLIISFDGSKWVPGEIDATAKAALKDDGTGTFKYLYEAGNDISALDDSATMFPFPEGTIGSQDFYAPVLSLCSPDTAPNYTYDGTNLTLILGDWYYITNVQVVVTGLTGDPEDWCLSAQSNGLGWYSIRHFQNTAGNPGFNFGFSGSRASRGTSNTDGVAFYLRIPFPDIFYNVASDDDYADHEFKLSNSTTTYTFTKVDTPITSDYAAANPSATDKEKLGHTFTAVKIPFTSFSAI